MPSTTALWLGLAGSVFISLTRSTSLSAGFVVLALYLLVRERHFSSKSTFDTAPLNTTYFFEQRLTFKFAFSIIVLILVSGLIALGVGMKPEIGALCSLVLVTFSLALAEELFFRRGLFGMMREHSSNLTALVGSSLVFGLFHFGASVGSIFSLVFVGLILGSLYIRTEFAIAPVTFFHSAHNLAIHVGSSCQIVDTATLHCAREFFSESQRQSAMQAIGVLLFALWYFKGSILEETIKRRVKCKSSESCE